MDTSTRYETCCRLRQKLLRITGSQGLERANMVKNAATTAIYHSHTQCLQAILEANDDLSYLRGPFGIHIYLTTFLGTDATNVTQSVTIMLNNGLSVISCLKVLCEMFGDYELLRGKISTAVIQVVMQKQHEDMLSVLLVKQSGEVSKDVCYALHELVARCAAAIGDEELVNRLVDAGTDKSTLMDMIDTHESADILPKEKADRMRSIIKKELSLQMKSRLAIWKSLCQVKDIVRLGLPKPLVKFCLFEDKDTGYDISEKLYAEQCITDMSRMQLSE